ncbi:MULTISPECIES: DsbA family oxidoreductase [unclassified Bacillus (in: firmicutes)]|uniref:DsbA family oxidoreductase n=1 Tax=unclassified Bacillus (in: firmicutes) TaxID=185979 RepID=UPI002676A324|nr:MULTISPECIES: DsbA family oxidoreductase [unclassified Bacillus (in: firmicutes)]
MGKRRLEDAIKQINHPIEVEVTYRCFELDPTMERDINENIYEKLAKKYGMSLAQAKANAQNVVQMAKEAGLDFQMDTLVLTNTFDAHRLTMYAKTQGLMKEMTERILRAHFTESKHIGKHETLTELAVEVGLNREAVQQMLSSDEMADVVRADEQTAQQYRITGVPFYLINKKYALTGAQPTEVFVQALQKIIAEDEITVLNEQDGVICDDNGCEIPEK